MSTAFLPHGTKLFRQHPTTQEWQEITQVSIVGFVGITHEKEDYTNHSSPGGVREQKVTLKTPNPVPCQVVFDPDNLLHRQLFADNIAATELNWRIQLPNATQSKEEFEATVSISDSQTLPTQIMRVGFSLEPTGIPTFTW
jgi:hypothetical protein